MASLSQAFAQVRLLALDVDGTLTDGGVLYSDSGAELKQFHIQDGLGMVLAAFVGLRIVWITGRTSALVERRAAELGILTLRQGVKDKATALQEIAHQYRIPLAEIAYMGDDLNDLPALQVAGVRLAPANAVEEVRTLAHHVTTRTGGDGAVREVIDLLLKVRGEYDIALGLYLNTLGSGG